MSVMDCVRVVDLRRCQRRRHWDVGDRHQRCSLQRVSLLGYTVLVAAIVLVVTMSHRTSAPSYLSASRLSLPTPRSKHRSQKDVYLCGILRGRVGNAFFNYASIVGIARANNMTLVLKDESVLPEVLEKAPRTAPDFEEKCSGALMLHQRRCCVLDERLMRLPHDDYYILVSCLISWRYFRSIEGEVKELLAFRKDVLAQARTIVSDVRAWSGNATLVGMHIRRGDQSGLLAKYHGHNPVTPEYVSRAMTYFLVRFPHVHFLVASQDSSWCRTYVARDRKDVTIMEGNSAAVDMAALTLTDHMIVSIGTYGWWAGYLNPGIKTYMKDFIGANSDFSNSFDDLNATDYIYPGWVPL